MWTEKQFNLGERRNVTLELRLGVGSKIIPENAVWSLTRYDSGVVEATGDCTGVMNENGVYELTALVEPKYRGLYQLIYTFDLGVECRKPCMIIKVK